jgi:hypothetical protein
MKTKSKDKRIFKAEIKSLEVLRNQFMLSLKKDGTFVILGEVNQRNLKEAREAIIKAIHSLNKIESAT